ACLLIGIAVWFSAGPRAKNQATEAKPTPEPASVSHYLNTRAGVEYTGDAACARCHAEIAATYRQHPMGRSLEAVTAAEASEKLAEPFSNPFEDSSRAHRYEVSVRDGHMFHRETRLDADGGPLYEAEHEVQFAVGAGEHGRSYLVDREGSLFLSPIT